MTNSAPARARLDASQNRRDTEEAFLDAAERLLVEVGYAQITTRSLAAAAGANHGLVHYYFGSMEELLARVLDRFTGRLVARQRAMYAADVPFIEKWKKAWEFQEEDLAAGYPKIWLELQAMSWNRPELRARMGVVNAEWRSVLRAAFKRGAREYRVKFPVEAMVALVMTLAQGYQLERLVGIRDGHRQLLSWIEQWLESLEAARKGGT